MSAKLVYCSKVLRPAGNSTSTTSPNTGSRSSHRGQGGAGSFTFLPYATWIDANSPTKFLTPDGYPGLHRPSHREHEVRPDHHRHPAESGLLAAPIIDLLRNTPFLGDLLAPSSAPRPPRPLRERGFLVPAGKQVAYTIKVTSFDGVKISTNFFPAAQKSLLPALGNQQATIFNGPVSVGRAPPTPTISTVLRAPFRPLGLMRGQGYPAPFDTAPSVST